MNLNLFNLFNRNGNKVENKASTKTPAQIKEYLTQKAISLTAQDMQDYRAAWQAALNPSNPNPAKLQDMYARAMTDPHLLAVLQQFYLSVLSKEFQLLDEETGEVHELNAAFHAKWSSDFARLCVENLTHGFTLPQIIDVDDNRLPTAIELVPRKYVKPSLNLIVSNPSDTTGIDFTSDEYANFLIPIGTADDLGLMLAAIPAIIIKRITQSSWAEHIQLFAAPLRVVKTDLTDFNQKMELRDQLESMGRSGFAVLDKTDEIDIKVNYASNSPYKAQIDQCDSEISKLFLGQTMTTDSGSSLSQAQVHQDTASMIFSAAAKHVENCFNTLLIPRLIALGARLDGAVFRYVNAERVEKATVVKWMMDLLDRGFTVEDGYVTQLTGIPGKFTGSPALNPPTTSKPGKK